MTSPPMPRYNRTKNYIHTHLTMVTAGPALPPFSNRPTTRHLSGTPVSPPPAPDTSLSKQHEKGIKAQIFEAKHTRNCWEYICHRGKTRKMMNLIGSSDMLLVPHTHKTPPSCSCSRSRPVQRTTNLLVLKSLHLARRVWHV